MESSPFRLARFISAPQNQDLQASIDRCPPFHASLKGCLVVGPQQSGRTSILFHYAVAIAGTGRKVLFICMKDAMESAPPTMPSGITTESPQLANIMMRYMKTSKDIRKYASCFHLLDDRPSVIIIDNLSAFVEATLSPSGYILHDEKIKDIAKTLAWLWEAVESSGNSIQLVVSDFYSGDQILERYVYFRWLPLIFTLTGQQAGGPTDFLFSVNHAPRSDVRMYTPIKYGFVNGTLVAADLDW
ncbi:hypothetical protein BSKO_10778 [Bryopsis sp. KO-2023]|nr:hypothetical protein BSKO_10778 [Bryopsis sp. KO-2023]